MGRRRLGRLLPDEQMARAMERQTALLLGGLGRDEPHVDPGDGLADGGAVHSIISGLMQRNTIGANRETTNVAVARFERADHPAESRLVIMFGMAVVDMLVQHDA